MHAVQGETVATPGCEVVGKLHCSDVKPIKKRGDKIQWDGKPVKNCARELQQFGKPVKNCILVSVLIHHSHAKTRSPPQICRSQRK